MAIWLQFNQFSFHFFSNNRFLLKELTGISNLTPTSHVSLSCSATSRPVQCHMWCRSSRATNLWLESKTCRARGFQKNCFFEGWKIAAWGEGIARVKPSLKIEDRNCQQFFFFEPGSDLKRSRWRLLLFRKLWRNSIVRKTARSDANEPLQVEMCGLISYIKYSSI